MPIQDLEKLISVERGRVERLEGRLLVSTVLVSRNLKESLLESFKYSRLFCQCLIHDSPLTLSLNLQRCLPKRFQKGFHSPVLLVFMSVIEMVYRGHEIFF